MAKQIVAVRKLILSAGKATPAYPVGPILGTYGINLGMFVKEYNARTAAQAGLQIPVEVMIYADRSFTLRILEPTVTSLLRQAAQLEKGSGEPGRKVAGSITREQLRQVAVRKINDLSALDLEGAEKMIAGTARSMGITVID
jgi:large subunit ribosomal protein L11